jgi:hypothetical protein
VNRLLIVWTGLLSRTREPLRTRRKTLPSLPAVLFADVLAGETGKGVPYFHTPRQSQSHHRTRSGPAVLYVDDRLLRLRGALPGTPDRGQ